MKDVTHWKWAEWEENKENINIRGVAQGVHALFQTTVILRNWIICSFDTWYFLIFYDFSLPLSQTVFWYQPCLLAQPVISCDIQEGGEQLYLSSSNGNASIFPIKVSSKPAHDLVSLRTHTTSSYPKVFCVL